MHKIYKKLSVSLKLFILFCAKTGRNTLNEIFYSENIRIKQKEKLSDTIFIQVRELESVTDFFFAFAYCVKIIIIINSYSVKNKFRNNNE